MREEARNVGENLKTVSVNAGHIFLDGEKLSGVLEYKLENSANSVNTAELTVKMLVGVGQSASESKFDEMENDEVGTLVENTLEQCEATIRQAEESRKIFESAQKSYRFLTVICAIMCGLALVLIGCVISYFATLP